MSLCTGSCSAILWLTVNMSLLVCVCVCVCVSLSLSLSLSSHVIMFAYVLHLYHFTDSGNIPATQERCQAPTVLELVPFLGGPNCSSPCSSQHPCGNSCSAWEEECNSWVCSNCSTWDYCFSLVGVLVLDQTKQKTASTPSCSSLWLWWCCISNQEAESRTVVALVTFHSDHTKVWCIWFHLLSHL